MATATRETGAQARARIAQGSSDNDILAIHAFAARGVPPEEILPRENVFTFAAWEGTGRKVAKGATGVPVVTWVPRNAKNGDDDDGEKKTGGMMRRTARLFHISQTVPDDAPKKYWEDPNGVRPDAFGNHDLIKPDIYVDDPAKGGSDE
jgi:hypothetical protein